MPEISSLEAGYYRVPLPTVLTDSMDGLMRDFEIVTVRLRDKDGAEDRMDLEPTMVGPALWRQGRPMKSYRLFIT